MKYQLDVDRIHAFADSVDVEMIKEYLKAWDLICKGKPDGGKIAALEQSLRFRWLVASRSTIIQSSATHPGLCVDPEKLLIELFERFVL